MIKGMSKRKGIVIICCIIMLVIILLVGWGAEKRDYRIGILSSEFS